MSYIDGFVVPVKTNRLDEYFALSRRIAALYREHGALRCVECRAEDVRPGDRTSFPRAVELAEDETAVFAWIEYPDRATRDAVHKAVWDDPRMTDDLRKPDVLDGKRMIFGGFLAEVDL